MNSPTVGQKNRRLNQRRTAKKAVRVTCRKGALDLGPSCALRVLDLSESGVRMLVSQPLEPGEAVTVSLEGHGHNRPLRLTAKVIWCVPSSDGTHCVGIYFDKRLPYADLTRMV
jgi:hypothetical protein